MFTSSDEVDESQVEVKKPSRTTFSSTHQESDSECISTRQGTQRRKEVAFGFPGWRQLRQLLDSTKERHTISRMTSRITKQGIDYSCDFTTQKRNVEIDFIAKQILETILCNEYPRQACLQVYKLYTACIRKVVIEISVSFNVGEAICYRNSIYSDNCSYKSLHLFA